MLVHPDPSCAALRAKQVDPSLIGAKHLVAKDAHLLLCLLVTVHPLRTKYHAEHRKGHVFIGVGAKQHGHVVVTSYFARIALLRLLRTTLATHDPWPLARVVARVVRSKGRA